jgi:hypothetical protein
MKGSEGYVQAYNGQIAVDEGSQLIVATGLTQRAGDNGQLIPILEEAEKITGQTPDQVLADAGYKGEENFKQLMRKKIDGYVSLGREGNIAQGIPNKQYPESRMMYRKLRSPVGRARYKRRKAIVEPVFGWVKEALGFRRFSFRGLEKVRAEWDLVCLAVNLKRLHALMV